MNPIDELVETYQTRDNGNHTVCDLCGHNLIIGDYPFCKGNPANHQKAKPVVVSDDIPGGIEIRHGLVHDDGSPMKFYSKSEIARAAAAKGLRNHVEHVPSQGSDKSPHTTRWI